MPFVQKRTRSPLYLSRVHIGMPSTPHVDAIQPFMAHNSVEWFVYRDHSTRNFLVRACRTIKVWATLQNPTLTFSTAFFSQSLIRSVVLAYDQTHLYALQREYFRLPEVSHAIVKRIGARSRRSDDKSSMTGTARLTALHSSMF